MKEILKKLQISTIPPTKYHIKEVNECGERYYLLYLYEFFTESIYDISILVALTKNELKTQAEKIYNVKIEIN